MRALERTKMICATPEAVFAEPGDARFRAGHLPGWVARWASNLAKRSAWSAARLAATHGA